jgi:hypothetical protein
MSFSQNMADKRYNAKKKIYKSEIPRCFRSELKCKFSVTGILNQYI